jgi:hypothetical protein
MRNIAVIGDNSTTKRLPYCSLFDLIKYMSNKQANPGDGRES